MLDPISFKLDNDFPERVYTTVTNQLRNPARIQLYLFGPNPTATGRKMRWISWIWLMDFISCAEQNTSPYLNQNTFIDKTMEEWCTLTLGSGISLYHTIYGMGGCAADMYASRRALSFVFKGDPLLPVCNFSRWATKWTCQLDCTLHPILWLYVHWFGPAMKRRKLAHRFKWSGLSWQ